MQRILASILSLLILLSSTGLTYAEHYCGEHKMMGELTLGHASLSCGMVMPVSGCDTAPVSMDCCDNEYLSIDLDDDFAKATFDFDFSLDYIWVSPINQEISVSLAPQQELVGLPFYRPPPEELALFILYESFLI